MARTILPGAYPATLPLNGANMGRPRSYGIVAPRSAGNSEEGGRLDQTHQVLMLTSLRLDPKVPVLVLKTGRYVLHHGTLGIVRSLGRLGVPVSAVIEDGVARVAICRDIVGHC